MPSLVEIQPDLLPCHGNYKKTNVLAVETSQPEWLWATDCDPKQYTSSLTYSRPPNQVWLRSNLNCYLQCEKYMKTHIFR